MITDKLEPFPETNFEIDDNGMVSIKQTESVKFHFDHIDTVIDKLIEMRKSVNKTQAIISEITIPDELKESFIDGLKEMLNRKAERSTH